MSYRRRHTEDDDVEVESKRRRGPPDAAELEARIVNLILTLGEKKSSTSTESNLEGLVSVLEQNLDRHGEKIVEAIAECAKHVPDRLTLYSTLVGLLNAKRYNFGGEIVEKLVSELQLLLDEQKYKQAANMIAFLCDLGNCRVLSLTSIVEFLEGLLEMTNEENVPQVRTDWFVYVILRSLPWIGHELFEKKKEELGNILDGINNYIKDRKKDYVRMLKVWSSSSEQQEQEEYLDCLYAQIQQLAAAEWKERHIPRTYIAFDNILADALQHNLPSVTPAPHSPSMIYPLPTVVFRLFDYADCPEDGPVLPGAHSIERFLVEEDLGVLIDLNELNRRECATALLAYPRGTSIPLEYVILETIFGRLFRLPQPPQPKIFYGCLLIELCRLNPNTMPQVLAQAAELLYERAETMQPTCLDRFVDWFSYHLSNFQYRWSWQDWNDCLEAPPLDAKLFFAREVLEKCMRLSYYERLAEFLPQSHLILRPKNPLISYHMDDESDPDHEAARHFTELFQQKVSAEDLIAELRTPAEDMAEQEFDVHLFEVFFSVLLKLAAKSFSHNFAALTRYHQTLKVVADNEEMQMVLLRTLYQCWHTNYQMMLILIDKLVKMQIVDCRVVVEWIFSDDMKDEQPRQWIWELLNNCLEKLSKHIEKLRRDLVDMKKEGEKRKERKEGDEDNDEEMEDDVTTENAAAIAKEAQISSLSEFQKNLFLDVMLKFSLALSLHVEESKKEGKNPDTLWFRHFIGRMRNVFVSNVEPLQGVSEVLNEKLFANSELDPSAIGVFQEFQALRA